MALQKRCITTKAAERSALWVNPMTCCLLLLSCCCCCTLYAVDVISVCGLVFVVCGLCLWALYSGIVGCVCGGRGWKALTLTLHPQPSHDPLSPQPSDTDSRGAAGPPSLKPQPQDCYCLLFLHLHCYLD